MKKCPFCGRNNDDDADICLYCYAAVPHDETQKQDAPEKQEETPVRGRRKR